MSLIQLVKEGTECAKRHDFDGALRNCSQALAEDPFFSPALWSRSFIKLLQGDYSYWAKYEWLTDPRHPEPRLGWYKRRLDKPVWDGNPLNGKTIYLYIDNGYGDFFQFVRYTQPVKATGGKVLLEALPQTAGLFRSYRSVDNVVIAGNPVPHYDIHCPLMLLPSFFGIEKGVYAPHSYLHKDEQDAKGMADIINAYSGTKVGVVWKGNPKHKEDANRSVPVEMFYQFKSPSRTLFSLQRGEFADGMVNIGIMLYNWCDTVNAIHELDLVITVDTAVAHLAGAMGKTVWLLTPYCPDWRWLLDREDTPWYPTMRLFRQKEPGNWQEVFERVKKELG